MKVKLFQKSLVEEEHKDPSIPTFRINKGHIVIYNRKDRNYSRLFYIHLSSAINILGVSLTSYYWK